MVGFGPLAEVTTRGERLHPAFGGDLEPGLHHSVAKSKFANLAPLGLSAFALTMFVFSLINVRARGVTEPNLVISLAFAYGGLVQLLAGMWEMAVGNTFGATTLSSYGGFWISFGIILTPGGFNIVSSIESGNGPEGFADSMAFFLLGWFIFTTIILLCTLKSTVAFFMLFLVTDLALLMLACSYLLAVDGKADEKLTKASGALGLCSAFLAWYNALAGIADSSNSFFVVPVLHFPWSEKGRESRSRPKHSV